jgi:hypothetical protein
MAVGYEGLIMIFFGPGEGARARSQRQVGWAQVPRPFASPAIGRGAMRTWSWRAVWLNCLHKCHPNAPFGGFKMSGYGREQGREAWESYTQYKTIWANLA